jgi:hypothetical protein
MSGDRWSESKGSLLDSLATLGYSGRWAPLSGPLALCFEDTCEILWMVVCYRRTAHPLRADGTGGRARSARRSPSRQWGQRVFLVWHHDFWRRIVGRVRGIGDESTPVDTESEDRRVDALFEM